MTFTLEHLDPATLLVDVNVRTSLNLDKAFCQSVKDRGVLVPIVAVRTDHGLRVRDGHRRTAAAIDADLRAVPVVVVDDDGTEATRIVNQLVVNTHRAGLTDTDTIAAVEQLALLGASAATIAKKTRLPRTAVDQALTVADHAQTRSAVAEGLTLEMAAWLAEFEDDPDTWQRLRDSFRDFPSRARHTLERARAARDERAAMTAAEAQLAAQGATRYAGQVWEDRNAKHLADLVDADGTPITPAAHQDCPGHAYDLTNYARTTNATQITGPGGTVVYACWLCTDYRAHGHRDRYKAADSTPDPTQDEQREQRRQTIALNKAGDAAKTVRVEWLEAFTKDRSAPPRDWPVFMLDSLHNDHSGEDKHAGWQHVRQLLGLTDATIDDLTDPARAARLLLCARLWTYEDRASKEIWRQSSHRLYLAWIERWGYALSDAERAGAGHITAEAAHQALTQDES